LYFPAVNYVVGDHEPIREMLTDSGTLLGLSDGGAHCTSIVDAGVPSFMLAHWGRDRQRGPRLPLELLVKRQTSETADFFGLSDRGRLALGFRADVNLIDFDNLRLQKPELVHDMPAGGRRFVQRVEGYGDARGRDADLRARRAHRRHARPACARRRQWRGFGCGISRCQDRQHVADGFT
jgi:N-acyl-D-aspartate/D-glutamate deacylase